MIITPVKKDKPNITQSLIRNFIPIPLYDEAFGVVGMYSNLEWLIDDDKTFDNLSLYVVINMDKVSIDVEVIHKFLISKSKRIVLFYDWIVIEFDVSDYNTDVEKILMGQFSKVSEKGKNKLLENVREFRNSEELKIRDSRWKILRPTKQELNKLCDVLEIKHGSLTELLTRPDESDEMFFISTTKSLYDLLWKSMK